MATNTVVRLLQVRPEDEKLVSDLRRTLGRAGVTCQLVSHVHQHGHRLVVHVSVVERHSQVAFFHVAVTEKVKGEVCRPVDLKQRQKG